MTDPPSSANGNTPGEPGEPPRPEHADPVPPAPADPFATRPPAARGVQGEDAAAPTVALPQGSFAAEPQLIGQEIAGVTIVRLIAEGGMGRVYEGRQDKPGRPVAVKIIKPGLVSRRLLKRFAYEAEVLGRLRHPGIAQIYSVGTHDFAGVTLPYFVMEFIPDAKTLIQFANDNRLSTHERLELFRKVCDAVAHGHQKGVIHRDLKPGNIVVDSSGQPKVIDFGVACTTDGDVTLTSMHTDVGALIGTLQYMSPEQFDADPNDLDVRLDVYSLGVVLYELLTGKPPYDVRRLAIHEIARVVREDDPTPISSLNKTLRRDVAIIAGKCLEKNRQRRYSSAAELAGDVGRYLAGESITAAPPSFFDAVGRLARRHRAAATTVAGIAASLVAAVIGISLFAIRAERARQDAVAQREEADLQRSKATSVFAATRRLSQSSKFFERHTRYRGPQASLGAMQRLDPATAASLATLPGALDLTNVDALTEETARSLATHSGPLHLRGMTTITLPVARILCARKGDRHEADLSLGVADCDAALAEILAQHVGVLRFTSLVVLRDDAAVALGRHRGGLEFDRLQRASNAALAAVAAAEGDLLFKSLSVVGDEAAAALGTHRGFLGLYAADSISDAGFTSLAKHDGPMFLDGQTSLTVPAAAALATHVGVLGLNRVQLTAAAARALAKHQGQLSLEGIEDLAPDVAEALADHEGVLVLEGLSELSPEAAAALAPHRGDLELSFVVSLTAEAARGLRSHRSWLGLDGLVSISDPVAAALGSHYGGLNLSGLNDISDTAAQHLSRAVGDLWLDGLVELSPGAAESLGRHQHGVLRLRGLSRLSQEAAAGLARHQRELDLPDEAAAVVRTLKNAEPRAVP